MACEHDAAIRAVLLAELRAQRAEALIVQEWKLPSIDPTEGVEGARADVGIIGRGIVEGFEIKSAADSTARLRRQELLYSAAFHFCTLVTAPNHRTSALKILPSWWGVRITDGGVLSVDRPASYNANAQPERLLWFSELNRAIRVFDRFEAAMAEQRAEEAEQRARSGNAYHAPRPYKRAMIRALAGVARAEVARFVCRTLRGRRDWRLPDGRSVLAAIAAGRL